MSLGPDPSGLRTGDLSKEVVTELRERAKTDLYLFAKAILGYSDLTIRTHKDFCDWLVSDSKRKLGLMPRGHFKSTLSSMADSIRRLAVNPNETILIVNESAENAEYMLAEIKEHFTNNAIFRAVYPDLIPKDFNKTVWSRKSILIPRPATALREPSIDTAGVGSKIVSRHYRLIKGDDLISDEAMFSPAVMGKAIKFVNRLVSLLVHPLNDSIHIIGTRWAYGDVYGHIIEEMPHYDVFVRKAIVQGAEGPEPFFPERYSMEIFQSIIENDPNQWATQYANDPLDTSVADFRPEWLQYFKVKSDRNVTFEDEEHITHIVPFNALRFYIHWDPSVGDETWSDYAGIVVVGISPAGQKFVFEALNLHVDPLQQTMRVLDLCDTYMPVMVTVESNAFQKSLKYFVDDELRRRQKYFRIEPLPASSHKSKRARILGALQPQFSTRQVWVRKGLVELVNEYLHYGKSDHEHMLDALAQGPGVWRLPMSQEATIRRKRRIAKNRPQLGVTGYGA